MSRHFVSTQGIRGQSLYKQMEFSLSTSALTLDACNRNASRPSVVSTDTVSTDDIVSIASKASKKPPAQHRKQTIVCRPRITALGSNSIGSLLSAVCLSTICIFSAANSSAADSQSFGSSIDFTMFRLATEHNDPSAQYLVGRNYLLGKSVEQSLNEAIKWFERAAKQGHTKAQYQLGKLYLTGNGVQKNYKAAFDYLSKAANNRHAGAQYELGNYYLLDTANGIDYAKAIFWYRKAADKNHRGAFYKLGRLLHEGKGKEESAGEALHLLTMAADSGLGDAISYLRKIGHADAIHDTAGSDTPSAGIALGDEDDEHSILATQQDVVIDAEGQYRLALSYIHGDGVEKNPATAARILQKLADNNHYQAQYELALLYRDGSGVPKNDELALNWLKQAAQNGSLKAQREINKLNNAQSTASADIDPRRPPTRTTPSAHQAGNTQARHTQSDTHYILGLKFLQGDGVEQDYSLAQKWLLKAARNNHSLSKYQLGIMYRDGLGVPTDDKTARHWLLQAADEGIEQAKLALQQMDQPTIVPVSHIQVVSPGNSTRGTMKSDVTSDRLFASNVSPLSPLLQDAASGNGESQYQLGLKYLAGNGVEKDLKKGIEWISMAADNGYLPAQLELGSIYIEGGEIRRDYSQAAKWYKKAAQNGDANAQYTLAQMYKDGLGLDRDNAKALRWYRKAANQGHKLARQQLGGCRIC